MSRVTAIAVVMVCASGAWADNFGTGGNQFTLDFVSISGTTNPTSGYGIVNNHYSMGAFEITNGQWSKFQAAYGTVTGDPASAYDEGPTHTGANLPANETSWYEAAQFVNWLNTSTGHQAAYQFTGTQGQGNYTLNAWSAAEADNGTNLYRHKDAQYFLPTEDEWVKAAYWNGALLQAFATTDDSTPVAGVDSNYDLAIGNPWDVGSGTEELNGTYDMMGNVFEWMESPYSDPSYDPSSVRGLRGGSYQYSGYSESTQRGGSNPSTEHDYIGFRVVSISPEPSSLVLLSLGGWALLRRRWSY